MNESKSKVEHWKMWLEPMNILWLKRIEGPLGFGLPKPAVFPPLARAFQEKTEYVE